MHIGSSRSSYSLATSNSQSWTASSRSSSITEEPDDDESRISPVTVPEGVIEDGPVPPSLDQTSASPTWSPEVSESIFLQTVRQIAQFGRMTFHLNRVIRCNGNCECICHSRSRIQSPDIFNRFLGHLFIGYAGLPIWTRNCNNNNCTNQYSRAVQVSYTFPGWLLSRTIDITAATTYTNEPQFGLKVRNRIENTENSVFTLARTGNLDGIKDLFQERRISPNDLNASTGQTALYVSSNLEGSRTRLTHWLINMNIVRHRIGKPIWN
jgi:hypothetical protein